VGLTSKKPEKTFEELISANGDWLSDLASCDVEEDVDDADDADSELGKLREGGKTGWLVGNIS